MEHIDTSILFQSIFNHIEEAIIITDYKGELLFFNKSSSILFGFNKQVKKLEWLEYFDLFKKDNKTKIERMNFPLFKFIKKEKVVDQEYVLYPKSRPHQRISIKLIDIKISPEQSGIALLIKNISEQKHAEAKLTERSKSLMIAYEGLRQAEVNLKNTNTELEKRVLERTSKLSKINQELKREILTRCKTEENLKQKNKELVKINADLDNFIYTASHDLRAPISNLEGLILALKDSINNSNKEDTSFMLELVGQSIEKFKKTIIDLTEISKVQKNTEEDVNEVYFSEILLEVQGLIQDLIISSGCIITTDFKVEKIKFSVKNLRSIFYNLLSNAIKYRSSDRKVKVEIKTTIHNNNVVLSFKDNGLGISPANQYKIFKMFKRAHDHVEGSGIGLYIVKRIIENADGKIELESKENIGSTFKIYFSYIPQTYSPSLLKVK